MRELLTPLWRILFFLAGTVLIGGGLAVKGFFKSREYRFGRLNAVLLAAAFILVLFGSFSATGPLNLQINEVLGRAIEPAVALGGNLASFVPRHQRAIQAAAGAFAVAASLLLFAVKKRWAVPLVFLLFAGSLGVWGGFLLERDEMTASHLVLAAAAFCCLASGFFSSRRLTPPHKPVPAGQASALLFLIVLVAFVLRIYRLGEVSYRFDNYEADYGLLALRMLRGEDVSRYLWLFTGWRGLGHLSLSPVYGWQLSWLFRLFGPGIRTLKLLPVLYGTLAVALTYGIVNILFGRRPALLSAFILAVSPMHINYSRIGLLLCSTLTVGMAMVYFFLKGAFHRKLWAWLLLGVVASFAGYYYSPVRFPLLVCGFVFAGCSLTIRRFFIRNLAGLLVFALTVSAVAAAFNIPTWDLIAPRFEAYESVWHRTMDHRHTSDADYVRGIPLVQDNVERLIRSFFVERSFNYDPWPRGNLYFNPVVSVLVLLGIGYSLSQAGRTNYLILLFFAGSFLLPNLLSRPAVMTRRTMMAWPFLCCLAALPISLLLKNSAELFERPARSAVAAAVLAGVLLLGAHDAHIFFTSKRDAGLWEKERAFAEIARELSRDYRLYIFPNSQHSQRVIDFILQSERLQSPEVGEWGYFALPRLRTLGPEEIATDDPVAVMASAERTSDAEMRALAERLGLAGPEKEFGRHRIPVAYILRSEEE